MVQKWMWYTAVLVGLFLVLSRWQAANALLGTGVKGYTSAVGVLQGRTVSASGAVAGIAR